MFLNYAIIVMLILAMIIFLIYIFTKNDSGSVMKLNKDGRTYTVEADVYGDGIKMWLLSQGRRVKVISPDDFVEEMKKEIERIYCNDYE